MDEELKDGENEGSKKTRMLQKPLKDIEKEISKFGWARIGNSQVTLWHRPGVGDIKELRLKAGVTLIVTLLSNKEQPAAIQQECRSVGIENFHIEINGANAALLSDKKTIKIIKDNLKSLHKILQENEHRCLIHCAAGIHRTGTLSYSLLRMDGREAKEAYETLKVMRLATYEGVGDWRIALAEKLILPSIMNNVINTEEEEKK